MPSLVTSLTSLSQALRSRPSAAAWCVCIAVSFTGLHTMAQTADTSATVLAASDWQDLSPADQAALKPLAQRWASMNPTQKQRWLALAKNYASKTPAEKDKLQDRMEAWAKLTPEERAIARQNFAQHRALTEGLTPEQRKAQWQAYELLSPEEKQKLAASSQKPIIGAASEVNPSNPLKNSAPPQFGTAQVLGQTPQHNTSKIAVLPHLKKGNSLMPLPSVADASVPAASAARP
jgi:hypothetical protein